MAPGTAVHVAVNPLLVGLLNTKPVGAEHMVVKLVFPVTPHTGMSCVTVTLIKVPPASPLIANGLTAPGIDTGPPDPL